MKTSFRYFRLGLLAAVVLLSGCDEDGRRSEYLNDSGEPPMGDAQAQRDASAMQDAEIGQEDAGDARDASRRPDGRVTRDATVEIPDATFEPDAMIKKDASTIPDAMVDAAIKGSRIFITKAEYTGNIGGLAGADTRCQAAADAAGLGGTFVAWLSDSTTDAIDRIKGTGPWYSMSGTEIFNSKAAVYGTPASADYSYDEYGNPNGVWYWTGTLPGGLASEDVCKDWSSAASGGSIRGMNGRSSTDQNWTKYTSSINNSGTDPCYYSNALLCFEE